MFNFHKSIESISLKEIAELTNGTIVGDAELQINSVSSLDKGGIKNISFFNTSSYKDQFMNSEAGACFVTEKYVEKAPKGMSLVVVKDPYLSFAIISSKFFSLPKFEEERAEYISIHESAKIGKNCHISNFVTIGKNVVIGDNVYIGPNVTIYDDVSLGNNGYIYSNASIKYAKVGNNFIFHDGVRIGQDGFGFAPNPSGHVKIPQVGIVEIGNNVEIGANTCIDRGALNNTSIGDGTKIDNLVQIAHNVVIGKHCFLAACVGIAGSSIIEDYVSMGGAAGVAPHVKIGAGSQVAALSGVVFSLEKGSVVMGTPAMNFTTYWRLQALFKRMLKK